ncbi:hatching enzyme 1.2 [Hydra vulgaris]|uniref:Metalloendopeptidase n=1 Tax=Hydra vulgaris TaxID=6087 RepID=A0ABM4BKR7_HYDVU
MTKFVIFACLFATVLCRPASQSTKDVKKDEKEDGFHAVIKINNKREKDEKKGKELSATEAVELFEADIVKTPKLMARINRMKRNESEESPFDAIQNGAWPNAIVPYVITNMMTQQDRYAIAEAINEYKQKTCIRFVPRTNEPSYVNFIKGGGCYSMIGRQGGRQDISLGQGCGYKGIAIHEMMHALGFFHEQSRRDRDRYIRVNYQNIQSGMAYNFDMYRYGEALTLDEPYDTSSIMHYDNYAFSVTGYKTIESLRNPSDVLGQRNALSQIDINQLNKYYNCKSTTVTTKPSTCEDGIYLCRLGNTWCSKDSYYKNNCKKTCNLCK